MSNLPIFDVAGSGLHAQSVRLSTIASNLANADSVAGSPEAVYKPLGPVFQAQASGSDPALTGVRVREIAPSEAPPVRRYEPGHPLAAADGCVLAPHVHPAAQLGNLSSASRSSQRGA